MRNSLIVVFVLGLTIALLASDKPDFSGSWEFDEDKSTLDDMGRAFLQSKMNVSQTDEEITIKKTFQGPNGGEFENAEELTLDGKECKSEAWGGSPRVTTAAWADNDDVLNIVSSITFERDGQKSIVDVDEAWSLGEDGTTLSIKHSSESNWGERNITMVFTKEKK